MKTFKQQQFNKEMAVQARTKQGGTGFHYHHNL